MVGESLKTEYIHIFCEVNKVSSQKQAESAQEVPQGGSAAAGKATRPFKCLHRVPVRRVFFWGGGRGALATAPSLLRSSKRLR